MGDIGRTERIVTEVNPNSGRPESQPLVQTRGLTKRYGARITAVRDLDLVINRGEVYGFLGPNGAGKTTTLRMLLGLIRPSEGEASVVGEAPGSVASLSKVGALVESPAFYPYLSGRDNLRVMSRFSGVSESRIDKVLRTVELSERSRDKFGKYSLGMKQRLGVAAALLKEPELLILDEPTNGLDPRGMADMRRLVRELGQGERTVLLSSHLLGEVEQICDRVGVIRNGALVAEGTVSELRGGKGLLVAADPVEEALEVVKRLEEVEDARISEGKLHLSADLEVSANVNAKLVSAGIRVSELRSSEQSLEQAFLELTGDAGKKEV